MADRPKPTATGPNAGQFLSAIGAITGEFLSAAGAIQVQFLSATGPIPGQFPTAAGPIASQHRQQFGVKQTSTGPVTSRFLSTTALQQRQRFVRFQLLESEQAKHGVPGPVPLLGQPAAPELPVLAKLRRALVRIKLLQQIFRRQPLRGWPEMKKRFCRFPLSTAL